MGTGWAVPGGLHNQLFNAPLMPFEPLRSLTAVQSPMRSPTVMLTPHRCR